MSASFMQIGSRCYTTLQNSDGVDSIRVLPLKITEGPVYRWAQFSFQVKVQR
jgi:hypothetical protein